MQLMRVVFLILAVLFPFASNANPNVPITDNMAVPYDEANYQPKWKGAGGRFQNIRETFDYIVKAYREKFDLKRNPLSKAEEECLKARLAAALAQLYYDKAVRLNGYGVSVDPEILAGLEANYNYFKSLSSYFCWQGRGGRAMLMYDNMVKDLSTQVPYDSVKKMLESNAPAKAVTKTDALKAILSNPNFWAGMFQLQFAPRSPAMTVAQKLLANSNEPRTKELLTLMVLFTVAAPLPIP